MAETEKQVLEIKEKLKVQYYRGLHQEIAKEYNISARAIHSIHKGQSWNHINTN